MHGITNKTSLFLAKNKFYFICHNAYYSRRKDSTDIIHLKDKAKILFEEDDPDTKKWTMEFDYDGQVRKLVYFYEKNFLDDWSNEINNISQILISNTPFIICLIDDQRSNYIEMIKKHISYPLTFNAYSGAGSYHNLEDNIELIMNDIQKTIETITIHNESEINKLDNIDYFEGAQLQKRRIRRRIEEDGSNDQQVHRNKM